MKYFSLAFLSILLFVGPISANELNKRVKTAIKEAKAAIKSRNNLDNAERALLQVVADTAVEREKKAQCYYLAGLLNQKINDVENEKLYLKKSYDTVRFFNSIYRMYEHFAQCDSLEMQPDEKGRVRFKYREKARNILLPYRLNLFNGGKYFMYKCDYPKAYDYCNLYITSADYPMFQKELLAQDDSLMLRAAYWATLSGYNLKNAEQTLTHVDLALKRDYARQSLQEYKARAYAMQGDTTRWLAALKEGLINYPHHAYYFASLMDYYNTGRRYREGLKFADAMTTFNPQEPLFWFAKSVVLMNMQQYEDCIAVCDTVIALDSTYVDAYYNKGISYCNLAVIHAERLRTKLTKKQYAKELLAVTNLYQDALEPMEMVRRLTPEDKRRWAPPLYRIYLKLNMGKEFEEMDKILKSLD